MIRAEPRGYPGGVDTLSVEEPWYGWDSEEADNGWLLTYVDVLSVILAMMVVLLGRMSVEQLPSAMELQDIAEAHNTSLEAVSSSARDDGQTVPSPNSKSIARTSPSTSKEERFNALVTQRFPGEATAVQQEHGVSIVIPDVILFESARANLQDSARLMLARLVTTLKEIGEADVSVEGHTDSRPIQGREFNSNWELAAARATVVTRYLLSRGLAADRLRAISYGDTRPVEDNSSPEGQAANRRVELRVEFVEPADTVDAVDVNSQQVRREASEYTL